VEGSLEETADVLGVPSGTIAKRNGIIYAHHNVMKIIEQLVFLFKPHATITLTSAPDFFA